MKPQHQLQYPMLHFSKLTSDFKILLLLLKQYNLISLTMTIAKSNEGSFEYLNTKTKNTNLYYQNTYKLDLLTTSMQVKCVSNLDSSFRVMFVPRTKIIANMYFLLPSPRTITQKYQQKYSLFIQRDLQQTYNTFYFINQFLNSPLNYHKQKKQYLNSHHVGHIQAPQNNIRIQTSVIQTLQQQNCNSTHAPLLITF
eukprot:TRINITY_DN16243_c0_g1_i1.p2 TRINITY_DN16243_c0_g1~~TRINITY_DN16243_c0_g1_i1.p2  ORF type:complete len:197 (+),score=-18.29 TRINITY_DN16243_c0_g1_i1:214-804(+)